jgi:hypothetical protein
MPSPTAKFKAKQGTEFRNSGITLWILAILLAMFFVYSRFFEGNGNGWKSVISSDGIGYYAYLPSLIIYSDPSWEKFTAAERANYGRHDYNPQYLTTVNGLQVNKYFSGEAILLLPFFLTAILFSWITGADLNGLSFWFQLFTGLGSLFYLLCGLYFLRKILAWFRFSDNATAIALAAVIAGTNLLYYAMSQPAMSHTFSFFAINTFLWLSIRFSENRPGPYGTLCGIMLGLVILLRPTNIILVFALPLFLNRARSSAYIKNILSLKKPGFIAGFAAILLVQALLWRIQTGQWLIMSYPDEGFYFSSPRIADFLFSFRRGWYIYTPLMFISLPGIYYLPGQKARNLVFFLLFVSLLIYISSSWWCWYYGDGFGQRPLVDFYGIFIVLLAALLNGAGAKPFFRFIITLMVLCIFLNIFQIWQYREKFISRDNMNASKYFYVFLRTADEYRDCLGGSAEEPFYKAGLNRPMASFLNGFEKPQPHWINQDPWLAGAKAAAGKSVFLFRQDKEFGPGIEISYDSLSKVPSMVFCDIRLMLRDSIPAASNQAMLVITADSINRSYNYYNAFRLNDIPYWNTAGWRLLHFTLNLPKFTNRHSRLKIYLWNPAKAVFMVDEMGISLYGRAAK